MDFQKELDAVEKRTVERIIALIRETVHAYSGRITKSALIAEIEDHYCLTDKICSRCKQRRHNSFYRYRKDRTRTSVCIACFKLGREAWRDKNLERIAGYKKKFRDRLSGKTASAPSSAAPTGAGG